MGIGGKTHALLFTTLACFFQGAFAQPDVEFVILSTWGENNYCGEIRVTSNTALSDWRVFATVNGSIDNGWNGGYRPVNNNPSYNAVFEPEDWNSTIPAGGTRSIGLCGSGQPPVFYNGERNINVGSGHLPLPFTELESGFYNNSVTEAGYIVANNEDDLQQIETLLGHELPVDIHRNTVIAAFMGERPTGGHNIQVVWAVETAERVNMRTHLTEPGRTCLVTMAFTSPYQIVTIPKTDKMINITEQKVVKHCGCG